ncbi:MAG: deoxyguanosinetriphosphate triphosphohydrolase [Ruminococcus sp.]|nr:deoxyguanosinetriphosphate triphosphohydrolase [Ruminococcus sp.]
MTPRERYEEFEKSLLCEYACLSSKSKGRETPLEKCDYRTEFQRDRDKIIHCNSFRRLKHKTQVFLSPSGDHYRTRLTHTLEVGQIARTIARALRLNEDLTEAIAMGHDLGHTPFGHAGERALDALCPDGFKHYKQGLRVVDLIENNGKGLDLTYEVRDGILKHTNAKAETLEGYVVRYADIIAYINHDIDDSIRGGILTEDDIPGEITDVLGHSKSERITSLVGSIIEKGIYVENGEPTVGMSDEINKAYHALHRFMFDSVYTNPKCKSEEAKAQDMLAKLYKHFCDNISEMPPLYISLAERFGKERAVCDYLSGMTDRYAIDVFTGLYIPVEWKVR